MSDEFLGQRISRPDISMRLRIVNSVASSRQLSRHQFSTMRELPVRIAGLSSISIICSRADAIGRQAAMKYFMDESYAT